MLKFRNHDSTGSKKRVWARDVEGDVFQVLTRDQFEHLKQLVETETVLGAVGITLTEEIDED
jgi:hypothetical protein